MSVLLAALTAGPAAGSDAVTALSVDQFAAMIAKNSLHSEDIESTYESARYGWSASRRSLTWPRLTANASTDRGSSDDDQGLVTDTADRSASVLVQQPLLTGTRLEVTSTWNGADTNAESNDVITRTETRSRPDVAASVSQPFYLFTGNEDWRNWRQANIQWENDQDTYRRSRLQMDTDARSLYYQLLYGREKTEVERKKLDSARLVHNVTRALVREGQLPEVELVRADIRASEDERTIKNSESDYQKQVNDALNQLSLPPNTDLRLTSQLDYRPFAVPLSRLVDAAMQHNPDIRIARRQIDVERLSLTSVRETNRPHLDASGSYHMTKSRTNTLQTEPTAWTVGMNLAWPFFDASQTRLLTKQHEISVKNAERQLEEQTRSLRVQIENAYIEMKRVEEQIGDFQPQREAASRNLTAIRLQYRNGRARLTDVFDAENDLRDLELEYLQLLVSHNTSRDQIRNLIGVDPETLASRGTR